MPIIDDLMDALATGFVDIRECILVVNPSDFAALSRSVRSSDSSFPLPSLQIVVMHSVPAGQVNIVQRTPPPQFSQVVTRDYRNEYAGEFALPHPGFFDDGPLPKGAEVARAAMIANPPWMFLPLNNPPPHAEPARKTLWEHLEEPWDEE